MENKNIPQNILDGFESDAMREGITNPHAFLSYVKMRTEQYLRAQEERFEREPMYDGNGNLTAYGNKVVGQSFFSMPSSSRMAKVISYEFNDLCDYLAKRGQIKKGKELFNLENFIYMRKSWYDRVIKMLKRGTFTKEEIPFGEYRKFAYLKIK